MEKIKLELNKYKNSNYKNQCIYSFYIENWNVFINNENIWRYNYRGESWDYIICFFQEEINVQK